MENIMYLDDYINLYIQKENKIYIIKPYKDTLENGKIINREKFIKKMTKVFNEKKINKFFNAEISIIINSLINSEDKKVIEYCLNEINYKKVNFIREEKFLKLDKNSLYINCNQTYINFYYIDYKGNTLIKNYQNDDLNKTRNEIPDLLNQLMYVIPEGVRMESIKNTEGRHVVIDAQGVKYEQLGYFKAKIKSEGILNNVTSTGGNKESDVITIRIEGDLP